MNDEYLEIPGADDGAVISQGMPDIFAYFGEYTRQRPGQWVGELTLTHSEGPATLEN